MVIVLQLSLFHLHGLERHPEQHSFASLLGLGTDSDQVHSVLYHCLVPSSKGKRSWVCPPGVAKVAIAVACP